MQLLTSSLMAVHQSGKPGKGVNSYVTQQRMDAAKSHIVLAAQPTLFSLKKTQSKTLSILRGRLPSGHQLGTNPESQGGLQHDLTKGSRFKQADINSITMYGLDSRAQDDGDNNSYNHRAKLLKGK